MRDQTPSRAPPKFLAFQGSGASFQIPRWQLLALSPASSACPQYRASDPWLGTAQEQLQTAGSACEARGNQALVLAGCQSQAPPEGVPHSQETLGAAPPWDRLNPMQRGRLAGRENEGSQVIVPASRDLSPGGHTIPSPLSLASQFSVYFHTHGWT